MREMFFNMREGPESKSKTRLLSPFLTMCLVDFVFFCIFTFSLLGCAQPEKLEMAATGGCLSCHDTAEVLPPEHDSTEGQNLEACLNCHGKDSPKLVDKMPLSHIHQLKGISCRDCHGEVEPPKPINTNECVSCHEIEKIVMLTSEGEEANPHDSPHYGTELDCDLCHHAHRKSEDYCVQCHDFEFVVPSPLEPLSVVSKGMNRRNDLH